MEDWESLRSKPYDEQAGWDAFHAICEAQPRASKSVLQDLETKFIVAMLPLAGKILRSWFRRLQPADCDDVCSQLALSLPAKVQRFRARFERVESLSGFTGLMTVVVRNLIYDAVRTNIRFEERQQTIAKKGQGLIYVRPVVSVPKHVDMRLALEELPEVITQFALARDRFAFGYKPINTTVRLLLVGKKVSPDMLRNWLGVRRPERCVAFTTLMARLYLHTYRETYLPILEGELTTSLMAADDFCHIF